MLFRSAGEAVVVQREASTAFTTTASPASLPGPTHSHAWLLKIRDYKETDFAGYKDEKGTEDQGKLPHSFNHQVATKQTSSIIIHFTRAV